MPGPVLPNTGIQLPALGGDAGDWDDELNACLENYDTHDHTPGSGVRVPVAGLDIDADLSMAGHGLTNIGELAFAEVEALAAGADVIYVDANDHELYWRTHAGVNVKLTDGAALNVLAFTGGIGGDYSAVGAQVAYDAANEQYTFQGPNVPPRGWSKLAAGDLHLYEAGTSEAVYTAIKAAAALAASYDITLPAAPPAAQALLQMAATGQLVASNTLPVDTDIVLSGAGKVRHGTKTIVKSFIAIEGNAAAGNATTTAGQVGVTLVANTIIYYPLPPLPTECTVIKITVAFTAAPANDVQIHLYSISAATPPGTAFIDQGFAAFGHANELPLVVGIAMGGVRSLWLQVSTGATGCTLATMAVDYTVP